MPESCCYFGRPPELHCFLLSLQHEDGTRPMGFQKSSARKENGITEHGGKQDKFEGKGKERKGPTEIESNFLITSGLTMN